MLGKYKILAINPGSTSTKIGVFENQTILFKNSIIHSAEEIDQFETIYDQLEFREKLILADLEKNNIHIGSLDAVVGRGGLLKPVEGGTYIVNEKMIADLKLGVQGQHASNLGGIIAKRIGDDIGKEAYIVDPVAVDEMEEISKYTGVPEINRKSLFHALNQKAVARAAAKEMNKSYESSNFIVAHLGGGISVGAHKKGRVIDVNNALAGDGPFSPERAGTMPSGELLKLCFSGRYTQKEIMKKLVGRGGLVAYLGTNDAREVQKMICSGDENARLIYKSMAYNVAKEIGSCAAVLDGQVDAIIITGGVAYDKEFVKWISEKVAFIGKIIVLPGEKELLALSQGALRVLRKEELAKKYV